MSSQHIIVNLSAVISTFLAIYCCLPYIWSILQGKTKPHQFSWIIFAILNGTTALSQFLVGARLSVLVPTVFFLVNFITIALSFKYGVRDTSNYDRLLFVLCLMMIVVWVLTRSNSLAIWLTVVIDMLATSMMILKIKAQPDTEVLGPWVIASVAYLFACLTLLDKPFGILYVRPMYGFLGDLALVIAIVYFHKPSQRTPNIDSPSRN